MSLRAVIIGLLGGVSIAAVGHVNDRVLNLESLVAGHLLPISVMGLLILAMVLLNPLLHWLGRWAFRPGEVAVMVTLMMAGCSIPARGLMDQFTPTLAMPAHWARVTPGWGPEDQDLLGYVPPQMLPAGGQYDPEVLEGFQNGGGKVPWGKWAAPLAVWVPLLALMAVCVICLGLIVHRQWSRHERLRYPIAEFATSLMRREPDRGMAGIFRARMFWIGLGILLALHVVNGINRWYPNTIMVPLTFDLTAIGQRWPVVRRIGWMSSGLLTPTLYPLVIAFSFFLASDISLSLGISHLLFMVVGSILIGRGVDISTSYMAGGAMGWNRFGAYAAFALMLMYVGRHYYWGVAQRAMGLGRRDDVPTHAVWACRVLLAAVAAMVGMLIWLGLDWPLAILTVGMMLLMFLGVSRISAETGLFFIQPRWQPLGVFLGLLGGHALGPQAMIIVGLLCAVLCLDPSQALMPYLVNGLKMCENTRLRPQRLAWGVGSVYLLGLAVAIPVTLMVNYDKGITRNSWSYKRVPTMAFRPASKEIKALQSARKLDASEDLSPVQRLTRMRPDRRFLWFAGTGFAMVLLLGVLRLRFTWWPLHPVIFLVWASFPMVVFATSFLLGWLIKLAVTRLGGHDGYRNVRTFMIGVIAGELLGGLTFMIVGLIYYALTGMEPIPYLILPR